MSFIWPAMLLSLVMVPLCVVLYVRVQRRRQRVAARYGSFGAVQAAGRGLGTRRYIPLACFMIGLTMMLIGLARPQAVVSLPRVEGTVILAFDVSGSMAADDVQPTRMEVAKAVAREFVQRQPSTVQIGVVAFSGNGFAVQAPTNDQQAILSAISRITPQSGTSLGQGILASLNTLAVDAGEVPRRYSTLTTTPTPTPTSANRSAVVVVLSDGENNVAPDPLAVAQTAAERGVRIYTVGIGSAAGTTLHINGFSVYTQLDEATLQQIAQLTEGAYYNAETQEDVRAIYDNLDLQLVVKPEEMEVTSLFAGVGLLALLIGGLCSLVWFGRVP